MFYELYKLSPKDGGGNRACEDFTTEILASLLKAESQFAQSFYRLIHLPLDDYNIYTQRRFSSNSGCDCIVDLVLESNDKICFIENKVESSEGEDQLVRYSDVLTKTNKTTFLRYCTKYYEYKDIADHHFHQFTWHQLSKLLRQYPENYYITSFYHYLKNQHMADSYELTQEKLAAAKFLRDTLKTFEYYLKISKSDFQSIFLAPGMSISKQEVASGNSIRIGWKIVGFDYNVDSPNELAYSIDFETQVLNVHLYYSKNLQYERIFR
ncbi:PD-(D/E)XK nuclease family protein [Sphingobacterium sp.]|uniref:PD-(D/E)XK nuclease family protein n=1 Tax=Sphingobacterium sp. TaxID=341027 RepID=UPI002896A8FB|nr:PD-(D/E)XK nuclease family protein [Sphingobacterium sp.]